MQGQIAVIGFMSHSVGALAFLVLTLLLVGGRRHRPQALLFMAASILTAAWAAAVAYEYATDTDLGPAVNALEASRTIAWLAFLWSMLSEVLGDRWGRTLRSTTVVVGGVFFVVLLVAELAGAFQAVSSAPVRYLLRLIMVIVGIVMIENLIRNSPSEQRWGIKFLCIGLGGMLAYDLFFFADALLFREASPSLALARGAVHALVVPLLAISTVRSQGWSLKLTISQKTAVYSTALIASGLYLLLMSASAFYIRLAGGSWGPVVQAVFLFGAIVLLAIILASGTFRAYLKVLIAKHFFRYKYDYRVEWMRFTRTVSESRASAPIELRVIQAIADTVDSPGGAMWLRQSGRHAVAATWNMAASSFGEAELLPLTDFLHEKEWVLDITSEAAANGGKGGDLPALREAFRRLDGAWILVPLFHQSEILGFVVLARPRAPRTLTWEDYDLLKMLARQAASYIAEQKAARELAESRQFERFNRRATFIMHDIKNLVSELSLISSNIERHGDNPAFRKDMTAVMKDAVAKMRRLMERLHTDQESRPSERRVALRPVLDELISRKTAAGIELRCDSTADGLAVAADRDRLSAMLNHLVANAIEASGLKGWVQIALSRQDSSAVVEVSDNGPGMDHEFIQNELFKPFRSTKREGFGIGAYQCREYARELGGDLEVISSPGAGTIMRVTLPAVHSAGSDFRHARETR